MNTTTLGIDIAKQVFQLHGTDGHDKVTLKKRLRRKQLLTFMQQLPPCLVGMEACAGAHYWAKKFQAYGHTVKLIAPQYVKPYVKTNKNDYNDAEAANIDTHGLEKTKSVNSVDLMAEYLMSQRNQSERRHTVVRSWIE